MIFQKEKTMEKKHFLIDVDFSGDTAELKAGFGYLLPDLNGEISRDGIKLILKKWNKEALSVERKGNEAIICYGERVHAFRALSLFAQHIDDENYSTEEKAYFSMNGVMYDVSQSNTVMTVEHAKMLLRRMALMGLNMVMFYNEDNYDVKEWPYFGYMRSRYTQADIREIDDYAYELGIEQIPCIQTLGHLTEALKWSCFSDIKENSATLLPGKEKTYRFIEDMIVAATTPVRSKRIHIGYDEAMKLGMGKYFKQHGLVDAGKIMVEHLQRIMEILDRHGLKPMLWGDMFMKRVFGKYSYFQQDYGTNISKMSDIVLPNGEKQEADIEFLKNYPKNAQIISYSYDPESDEVVENQINQARFISGETVYAGGIWGWTSFCPQWRRSIESAVKSLSVCKKNGVKEVFATTWGDEQTECPVDALLLGVQLWGELGYCEEFDEEKFKSRFEYITGASYETTLRMSDLDAIPGTAEGNADQFNATKCLLWQETLCGIHDKDLEELVDEIEPHYVKLSREFKAEAENESDLSEIFRLYSLLADVLEYKATIGCRLKKAYDEGDKTLLKEYAEKRLPELYDRYVKFYECHRSLFYSQNKAFGFEIFDIRHAAVMNRIKTAEWRLKQYLDSKVEKLDELEETRLYKGGAPSLALNLSYASMISASRITSTGHTSIPAAKKKLKGTDLQT